MGSAGIGFNSAGFAHRVSESSVFAVSIQAMNYGDIPITTVSNPEGNIGYFSPKSNIFNIGYAKAFSSSIYGGINFKVILLLVSLIVFIFKVTLPFFVNLMELLIKFINICDNLVGSPIRFSFSFTSNSNLKSILFLSIKPLKDWVILLINSIILNLIFST